MAALPARFVVTAPRLVTCDAEVATSAEPLGVIEDGALLVEHGRIADVGPRPEIVARYADAPIAFAAKGVVTPGLVDAHTHAPWMGSRHDEYAQRLAGADYEAIAKAGGGIVASMRAVRAASADEIASALRARLLRMASLGVTTVECKSGYGLDEPNERKQLEAVAALATDKALPFVVPTYLALHALPPEAAGDRDGYAARVARDWLAGIAAAGLCRYVDAYIDRSAFSVAQVRPVLERAKSLGLDLRLHVGQFADVGGCALAAELGAHSVDHLEVVEAQGIEALARAGVRAVLLPIASFTLAQKPPPIGALRSAGVPLVVASDANPGTAPTESLPLALALAARLYGLSVVEVILGATREAAASLGLSNERGALRKGLFADLVIWDLPHENALVQPWGVSRADVVLREGAVIAYHGQQAP